MDSRTIIKEDFISQIDTKELFKSYTLKPRDLGRGIITNFYNSVGSYKSKSLDYLGKLSQIL